MPVSFVSDAVSAFELLARRSSSTRILASSRTAGDVTTIALRHKGVFQRTDYDANVATMKCFRKALEDKFGVFGGNAFDTVLGDRFMAKQGLRGKDVMSVIDQVEKMKSTRVRGEVERQVACSPLLYGLDETARRSLVDSVSLAVLEQCKGGPVVSERVLVEKVRNSLLDEVRKRGQPISIVADEVPFEALPAPENPTEMVGLRDLETDAEPLLNNSQTSVEGRVKTGQLMSGMRINSGNANPIVLRSLKSKGVEPGFVYSYDWRACDTRAMMRAALPGEKSLAGYAEAIIRKYRGRLDTPIGKAIEWACKQRSGGKTIVPPCDGGEVDGKWMSAVKGLIFADIRDEIANPRDRELAAEFSGVGTRFRTRHILKLDYNERDRMFGTAFGWRGSGGQFVLSPRVLNLPDKKALVLEGGGINKKYFLRLRKQTAFGANVGAVAEALANDLMRVTGIPSQSLSLSLGKYSDGKPKLLLHAEFAEGYHDLDYVDEEGKAVMQDGYLAKGVKVDGFAKHKIAFLLFGDRDAIGSHGQNKGFITHPDGRRTFFAIDPGKTLEGNARVVKDDFSFNVPSNGFENFTVFDDFKRSEKFAGVLAIEGKKDAYERVFRAYLAKIRDLLDRHVIDQPLHDGILLRIAAMRRELFAQYDHIMEVFKPQRDLYQGVLERTGKQNLADQAIDALDLMEKLTSPTSTMSSDNADAKRLDYRRILPGKRNPWTARVTTGGALEFSSMKNLSDAELHDLMIGLAKTSGGAGFELTVDEHGRQTVRVPADQIELFLGAIDEHKAFDGV